MTVSVTCVSLPDSTASVSVSEQATWGSCVHGPMPRLAMRVAVVGVMLRVSSWTCHWPTKRALAVAEGMVELVGPEELAGAGLALPVAAELEGAPVVEEVFEHPSATTVTISVAAMATTAPDLARRRNDLPGSHIDAVTGRQYGTEHPASAPIHEISFTSALSVVSRQP